VATDEMRLAADNYAEKLPIHRLAAAPKAALTAHY